MTPHLHEFSLRVAGASSHEQPLQGDELLRRLVAQQLHLDERSDRPLGLQARLAQHHLQGRHEQPRPETGQSPLVGDGHCLGCCSSGLRPHIIVHFKACNRRRSRRPSGKYIPPRLSRPSSSRSRPGDAPTIRQQQVRSELLIAADCHGSSISCVNVLKTPGESSTEINVYMLKPVDV